MGVVCLLWDGLLVAGFVRILALCEFWVLAYGCDLVYYGVLVGCCFRLTLN